MKIYLTIKIDETLYPINNRILQYYDLIAKQMDKLFGNRTNDTWRLQ